MAISYARIYAPSSENRARNVQHMAQYAALATAPLPNLKALDFGCATGFLLEALSRSGIPCEGIDTCPDQIRQCHENGLTARFVKDSTTWLQDMLREGTQWNSIFLLDVLEHVPADEQVVLLELFFQALPAGGRLVLKVPNPESIGGARMIYGNYTHRFAPTAGALAEMLGILGFSKVVIQDEIPWATHTFRSVFSLLVGTVEERRRFKYDLFYLLSKPVLRMLRRIAFASEIGLEAAFGVPLSPNYLCIATK